MTLSQLSYDIWSSMLNKNIEKLNVKKGDFTRSSLFGGRTYPVKKYFKSKLYSTIIKTIEYYNNLEFPLTKFNYLKQKLEMKLLYIKLKKSNDYIFNADVNSLYPASMVGKRFSKEFSYPIGISRWSDEPKKEFDDGKMGIFNVKFKAPKTLTFPMLPYKNINGRLEWGLNNDINKIYTYTSVDIRNAIKCGYDIQFTGKCLVWDEKCNFIFNDYINKCYDIKKKAKGNNKSLYQIGKLLMNALYGKMNQKPNTNSFEIINTHKQLLEFLYNNELINWTISNDNKYLFVEGERLDKEKCYTKPSQLGVFILAYSRQIMMELVKEISPKLDEFVFTYTDTDSIHIKGKYHKKLIEKGLIDELAMGLLANDCDDEGLIIREINLAPKLYLYQYLNKNGELKLTLKGKGIPNRYLKKELYEDEKTVELGQEENGVKLDTSRKWTSLRKIHKTLTKKELEMGMRNFSIKQIEMTRTFLKNFWNNENYDQETNIFFPTGFDIKLYKKQLEML